MIWQEEMQRDAVRIAIPEWDLKETDVAKMDVRWDNGEYDFEWGYEPDGWDGEKHTIVTVFVSQVPVGSQSSIEFRDEQAVDFLAKLFAPEGHGGEVTSALQAMIRIAQREILADAETKARLRQLEIGSARDVYNDAMYWSSVSDEVRAHVHDLAQNHGGKPGSVTSMPSFGKLC